MNLSINNVSTSLNEVFFSGKVLTEDRIDLQSVKCDTKNMNTATVSVASCVQRIISELQQCDIKQKYDINL